MKRISLLLLPVLAVEALAWHTPPHQQITRAAIDSLPAAMQARLGTEKEVLITVNCMFPDRYRALANANPAVTPEQEWLAEISPRTRENFEAIRATMKVYCEMPDGRIIHNVTQNRPEDVASLEHLLHSIITELRRDNASGAARYMGTLSHLIEDSVSPAHAGKLPAVVMELRKRQPIPNPSPWTGRMNEHGGKLTSGNLHAAIELTTPPFTLAGRSPRQAGRSVAEAVPQLLDRCYAIVEENRADLFDMVRAAYADDRPLMDQLRLRAARKGAELLADACYTALAIAAEKPD